MTVLAILLSLSVPATPTLECEQIRALVGQHGKVTAYAWALSHGYSPKEIARIRRICGV